MITGIDHPTSGSVRVGGVAIHQLSENDMSLWRGRNLGIVFQFFQLMPTLSLLENVMLPMVLLDLYAPLERLGRARDLLNAVGLAGFEEKLPAAVSGGQQQCAAIARALANDPPILIADEPTGNLDSRTAEEVFDIFTGLAKAGKTILMVTHDPGLARRTNRTLLISDGELVDPWVAAALPDLLPSQMMWLTHHLQRQVFTPGSLLAEPGTSELGLWLVKDGPFQVTLNGNPGHAPHQIRLNPGDIISELDLKATDATHLMLQAAGEQPVEVLSLERQAFRQWLQETPSIRDILDRRAREGRAS
jgi:putative ABC transport system ATP-binding protein